MAFIVRNANASPFTLQDDHLYMTFEASEGGVDLEGVFEFEKLYYSSLPPSGALYLAIQSGDLVRRNDADTADIAAANAFDDAIWRWNLIRGEKEALAGTWLTPNGTNRYVVEDDPQLFFQNIVKVKLNPNTGAGEFGSIKDAIDSITTASAFNPFLVLVGPGIYVEDTITMKSFVHVTGFSQGSTTIAVNATNKDVIVGASNSTLKNVYLTGSTDAGKAAVRWDAASGGRFVLRDVVFGATDICVKVHGSSSAIEFFMHSCISDSASSFTTGILATNAASTSTKLYISECLFQSSSAPHPTTILSVAGSGVEIAATNLGGDLTGGGTPTGTGISFSDSVLLRLGGGFFRGFSTAVHGVNAGGAPTFRGQSIQIEDCTDDLVIEHPGTLGVVEGSFHQNRVTIDALSPITVVHVSTDGITGLVVKGEIYQAEKYEDLINFSKLTREGSTLGNFSGGLISNGGGFDVDVTAGYGFLDDSFTSIVKEFSWNATTVTLSANAARFIIVDQNGVITSTSAVSELTEVIVLGKVVTNGSAIDFIDTAKVHVHHYGDRVETFLRDFVGPLYGTGSITTEVGTRNLAVTAGRYSYATSFFAPSGANPITFQAHYRDGSGGWVRVPGQSQVSNLNYDDGSGSLANVPVTQYTKHTLYLVGDGVNEKYLFVYGQDTYATLAAAEEAEIPSPPPWFAGSVVPIASLIILRGSGTINSILDIRPRIGASLTTGVSASADHGNLLGLGDDDHQQYLLVDGTRAMTGSLNMGGNNITNVNLVDGVDVSAHASRHLPNGADPLTTAAPSTSLSATTANAAGVANSFARSDHLHDILTAAPVTQSPDQANAEGTAVELARADHVHNIPAASAVSIDAATANTEGVSTNFARADHTHDISTAAAVTQTPDQANAEGSSANLARADHVHNIPCDAPTTSLSATTANAEGTAGTFARSDHTHDLLTGVVSTQTPDQANAEGSSANLARADHVHNIPADPPVTLTPELGNSEGVAASFARSDHTHDIPTAAAVTLTATSTNSEGVAASFARSDHTHDLATGAPITQAPDQANAEGSSANLARADHVHNIPAAIAVTLTPELGNAEGVSTSFARADHVHDLPTDTAVNVGTANTEGVAASFARSDHVHQGVHGVRANAGAFEFGDITLQDGSGIAVTNVGTTFTITAPSSLFHNEFYVTYPGSGLSVNYTGGKIRVNNTFVNVSSGSLLLTNATSGEIYVDLAGVVTATTGGAAAPDNTTPIAAYTTAGGAVTLLTDQRVWVDQNLVWGQVGDIASIEPDDAALAGTSNRYARADHQHAIVADAAITITPALANAEGVAASFARSDHVHNLPVAAPTSTLGGTSSNSAGSAATFARSDHSHSVATGAPISQTPDNANATGSGNSLARANHVHNIPTATPVNIGTANAQGAAASFARSDHVHQGIHALRANSGGTDRFGDLVLQQGTGISITDSGTGTFTIAASTSAFPRFLFMADHFDSPITADWAVNNNAPASFDSLNTAFVVRRFDDSAEEGVGFTIRLPTGATSLTFNFVSRAQTAPGVTQNVIPRLYVREVPDNASVEAWSAGTNLTALAFPTNTNYQYDTETFTFASLSLVAGRIAQFELTRNGAAAGDTLVGDWTLLSLEVTVS